MRYLKRYESISIGNDLLIFLKEIVTLFDKKYTAEYGKHNNAIYLYHSIGYITEMTSKIIIDEHELTIEIYTREFDINFLLADYLRNINGLNFKRTYTNHYIIYEYEIFNKEDFINNLNKTDFSAFIESNKFNL